MPGTTIVIGNWNDTTPAAPAGSENVKFQKDASTPMNVSAYVSKITNVATFLIGIGASIEAASNVAPVYRVKRAGTITKCAAVVKTALDDAVSLMIQRRRNGSNTDILSGSLTIDAESTDWEETTDFAIDDLEIGDELRADILLGSPRDLTIELYWS